MFLDVKVNRDGAFDVDILENTNSFVYVWRGNGFVGAEEKPISMGQVCIMLWPFITLREEIFAGTNSCGFGLQPQN